MYINVDERKFSINYLYIYEKREILNVVLSSAIVV